MSSYNGNCKFMRTNMDNSTCFVVVIFIIIVMPLFILYFDHNNIREDIESKGGLLLEMSRYPHLSRWLTLGIGLGPRLYDVTYADRDGNVHQASCKSSIISKLSYTNDYITGPIKKNG